MSKPYFAKWIATGEKIIRNKEYYIGPDKLIRQFHGEQLTGDIMKVKFFLCSRDVQVGDRIYNKDLGYVENLTEAGYNRIKDNLEAWIKVIGEISPEATWVKEGDEFDDEMLKGYWINEYYNLPYDESHKKLIDKKISPDNPLRFKIKGPCGHFH